MKSNGIDPHPDVGIRLLEGHDDSKNMETSSTITSSIWFSKRFFVMVLLFIGCINMYAMRGNLSIAIVEMTSNKTITIGNQTITRPPEFNWDSKTIGVVLTMFSYGYLCSLGGGFLATKFGGSLTYGTNMLLAALVTLLYPISLRTHFYLFLACRALAGLFESFAYASTAEVLSRWVPEKERSTLMAYSFSGIYIGTAVTYPFCGFLANKWGWPMVFYATGLICCTGSLLWLIFVRNEPRKDKWISKKELLYIEQGTENTSRKHIVHPYKSILTSKAFWALSLGKFSYSWGFTILVTCFPLYVKDMTGRATHEIGLISAIPNIVCIFMIPIAGTFMDYCQNNSSLKATQIHKIMMSIAFICGAILFMIVAFVTNFVISMACFVLIKVVLSINFLILQLISIHMAPRHSSVLAGLSAFWYTISTISTPTVIGFIVVNHRLEEWSKCFLLSSGILMFGAIVFILFGSSEIQPWALPPSFSEEENACDKNKKTLKPY